MKIIVVIGGGPAGMMSAIMAAGENRQVILLERNEKVGKKLYITGKGRCNITNASDVEEHLKMNLVNRKFLYSAFYTFNSDMVLDFFNENGLETKVERGNRAFPKSDKSSDVIKVLSKKLKENKVDIRLNSKVTKIVKKGNSFHINLANSQNIECDNVIIATGGKSYDMTGSTGDGYKFGAYFKHSVVDTAPGLVPFETKEEFHKELQGLALKNVNLRIENGKKLIYDGFGEMLFTHFGVSGPLIISGSSHLPKNNVKGIKLDIDLKPALSEEELDKRVLKDFAKYQKKDFVNALDDLLPKKLIPVIINRVGINPHKKVDQITKEERLNLVKNIKHFTMTINKTRGYNEAIITRGGINVREINPNTMESKLVEGLYFVGEVLDLDALTGGYNLQIAFSTGYLAGISV